MKQQIIFVSLIAVLEILVVGLCAHATDNRKPTSITKENSRNTENPKPSVRAEQMGEDADELKLRRELQNLERELKQLVVPSQHKLNQTDEKRKRPQSRIWEIQDQIQKLRGKLSTSLPPPQAVLSTKQLNDRIDAIQQEIDTANKAIKAIAEINPTSEELRMLKRRVAQKQRALNALIIQRKRAEDQKTSATEAVDVVQAQTNPRHLEIFTLKHADAKYAAELVQPFLTKETGVIAFDINTNSLIVKDVSEVLKDLQRILKHIDVTDK